jgi:hypothetical protein
MNEICPHELERALNSWITEGLGLNLEDDAAGIIIDGKVAARNSQRPWVSIVGTRRLRFCSILANSASLRVLCT